MIVVKSPPWWRHNKDERHSSFRKIYLSLYLKGLCVRGSWRPNRTATYWPPLLWPSALSLSRSPGLLNRRPRGPAFCWVLAFFTTSCLQTLRSPSWLNFLCTQLYNSSTSTQYLPITDHLNMHFRRLWNGMFDCHRAEITVMQFTGHSLPVHQFVTYRGTLTLSHIVSQARPRQWNMHFHRLRNGMFGPVEGQYTTRCRSPAF